MAEYDVIVIGGGPGGYVCAIRCAQLGLKTACVEGRETLGGTCLNVGCIPSKALLHATHSLHEAEHNFATMGLKGKAPSVDWNQMKSYKQDVVNGNTSGIEFLFKKNKVDWIKGWGSIPAAGQVKVGDEVHSAKNIVIASGSEAASIPGAEVEIDEKIVVTSTGALELARSRKNWSSSAPVSSVWKWGRSMPALAPRLRSSNSWITSPRVWTPTSKSSSREP